MARLGPIIPGKNEETIWFVPDALYSQLYVILKTRHTNIATVCAYATRATPLFYASKNTEVKGMCFAYKLKGGGVRAICNLCAVNISWKI